MPNIIISESSGIQIGQTYDYKYPLGNNFKPGSTLHTETLQKILYRVKESQSEMEKRYPIWDRIKQKLSTYVVLDQEDRKLKAEDPQRPVAVVIPILYTNLDTILTYWLTAFGDGPIFKYRGIGPEDRIPAMLLELLIDAQCQRMKTLLQLYVQWRDALACGLGIVTCNWHTEYGNIVNTIPQGFMSDLFGKFIKTGEKISTKRTLLWEANKMENIHPKRYFPDPNVPCQNVQDMEFVSFLSPTSYVKLLELERTQPESWFNAKYLDSQTHFKSTLRMDDNDTNGIDALKHSNTSAHTRPGDLLNFYCTIIPKEWKVGKSEYPEKWVFTVAGDKVIVRAQPMNLNHNKYPVSVCAPSFDGYSVAPVSILETCYEAQVAADFYYKTRITNLLTMVNNRGIIDPFLARYDDAINSTAGGWIRMREHVWGRGVKNAVEPLPAPDFTAGYVNEIGYLDDLTKRVTGAVDTLQGVVRPSGERRSATEMRDTRSSAVSRVQKSARMASLMSMVDLGYMFAYHLQQFSTRNAMVTLAGDNIQELQGIYGGTHALVTPDMMNVDFDVLPGDGTSPGGEYLPDLIQLFQMSQGNPYTAQSFDATKQVLDLYRRAGYKGATNLLRVANPQQMEQVINDPNARAVDMGGYLSSSGIGPNVPTDAYNG